MPEFTGFERPFGRRQRSPDLGDRYRPADNVRHLMLREDVVAAVADGQFHVYAIANIDDALHMLTGLPAGERGADDEYPPDSVNGRVARRLLELWQRSRRTGKDDSVGDSK